jgi:hypothetical protein
MKSAHLLQEQDGRLAADMSCWKTQTGPGPPTGAEAEQQNQVKWPTQQCRQGIVAVLD